MPDAPTIVVTFPVKPGDRAILIDAVGGAAELVWLSDLDDPRRAAALRDATVLLARHTGRDLRAHETALPESVRLIQFITAGVDHVPLSDLPAAVPVAANGGAYADAMAEHALAMALAAIKRLFVEHAALAGGAFNQRLSNRRAAGLTCGILGFGGIGVATARLMRAVGMRVHAINRGGRSAEPVDWIGTPTELDRMLAAADVLVIAAPLNAATLNLVGARELGLMKPDAVLVNLARGEIIDEDALFAHLERHPDFTACLDAWWIEPVRHGTFRTAHPFLTLPNVIGSPHNSAASPDATERGLRRAAENIRRVLDGGAPRHLVDAEDRAFRLPGGA